MITIQNLIRKMCFISTHATLYCFTIQDNMVISLLWDINYCCTSYANKRHYIDPSRALSKIRGRVSPYMANNNLTSFSIKTQTREKLNLQLKLASSVHHLWSHDFGEISAVAFHHDHFRGKKNTVAQYITTMFKRVLLTFLYYYLTKCHTFGKKAKDQIN